MDGRVHMSVQPVLQVCAHRRTVVSGIPTEEAEEYDCVSA